MQALIFNEVRLRLRVGQVPLTVVSMGTTATGTAHIEAKRRAHQVAERRAKVLREHEEDVTTALVGYFEAKARADKIRSDAQSRAARRIQAAEEKAALLLAQAREASQQLTAQAEQDAADADAQVGKAVRQLSGLGESTASIAEMTGLSQAVVRAIEREHVVSGESGPQRELVQSQPASRSRGGAAASRSSSSAQAAASPPA